MQQLDIRSFDSTPIHCYLWDDVENPKGVVQISHGMCEYAGRYHETAQMFNEHGYIVFADDHRAHGNTETDENRGRHPGDIEKKTVKDLVFFYNWLRIATISRRCLWVTATAASWRRIFSSRGLTSRQSRSAEPPTWTARRRSRSALVTRAVRKGLVPEVRQPSQRYDFRCAL